LTDIVSVYPPVTKLPPTAAFNMSVKAPPLIFGEETSSTAPSKVSSRLKLFLKVSWAVVLVMLIEGVSSVLLVTQLGSLWKAAFGAVSTKPVLTVVKLVPSAQVPVGVQFAAPLVKLLTHPAGSAGATTPSKFSEKAMLKTPSVNVYVTVPRLVAPSWSCRLAVKVPPQVPDAVKVKLRQTAGPPATTTP
jgi:hypothetical protein